jgi:hypothetical protein
MPADVPPDITVSRAKMPRSIARLNALDSSHRNLSSAVFITNITESDFFDTHSDLMPFVVTTARAKDHRMPAAEDGRCGAFEWHFITASAVPVGRARTTGTMDFGRKSHPSRAPSSCIARMN